MPSRRTLLARVGALTLVGGAGALLSACGSTRSRTRLGAPIADDPEVLRPNIGVRDRAPDTSQPATTTTRVAPGTFTMPSYVIARSRWASYGPRVRETNPMERISRITVHHDGMRPQSIRSEAQAARKLENIRRAHVGSNGWADIGYHCAIDPQGRVWEGRPWHLQGAHVRDQNRHNLGILIMGNFQRERPSSSAMASLERLLIDVCDEYGVPPSRIYGHRDLAATACPGKNLIPRLASIRRSGRIGGLA